MVPPIPAIGIRRERAMLRNRVETPGRGADCSVLPFLAWNSNHHAMRMHLIVIVARVIVDGSSSQAVEKHAALPPQPRCRAAAPRCCPDLVEPTLVRVCNLRHESYLSFGENGNVDGSCREQDRGAATFRGAARQCRWRYRERLTPKHTAAMMGALTCIMNIAPECVRDRDRRTSTPTHQATPLMNHPTSADIVRYFEMSAATAMAPVPRPSPRAFTAARRRTLLTFFPGFLCRWERGIL